MRDAYDVLDELNRAGVHVIATGNRLQWRCDPTRPPVPGSLFLELKDHKDAVRRILEALPARCVVPHLCCVLGPCDPARCRQAAPQQEQERGAA